MGAAEHVPGINQDERNSGEEFMGAVVAQAHELIHGSGHIGFSVERLEEALALLLATTVDKLNVLFLDRCAVHEHHCAEVAGCRGAEDVTLETVPDKTGDTARVIDVSVGKNQAIDVLASAGITAVSFEGFFAFTLKQAAVEHDGFAVDFEEVLRTGYGMDGAIKGNFHVILLTRTAICNIHGAILTGFVIC